MSKEDITTKNQRQDSENEKKETEGEKRKVEKVGFEEKNAKLEKTISELKNSILRLLADSENERKRHLKELEETRKYANKKLIRQILPFLDNYQKALELSEKMQDPKISNFLLGFQIMLKEFWNIMKSEGVEEIIVNLQKDLYDSDYHEVIEEVEDNNYPTGTILEVMQKGYLLNKRLLTPVKVKVSKQITSKEKEN